MFKPSITIIQESPLKGKICDTPEIAKEIWFDDLAKSAFFDSNKEHLIVVILNTKLKLIDWNLVSIGSVNEAVAHPREIFRPVIIGGAYAFLLMHNHPSGETTPSAADRRLTSSLREGASLLQLNFIDHIIVGNNPTDQTFSFRDVGLL
jgi:DNA repair protein RadC